MIKLASHAQAGGDVTFAPCRFTLLAAGLGMFFGIDFGFIIANQQHLIEVYILQERDIQVIVGSYLLGALLGVFLGGLIVYSSGRKVCMLGGAALGLAAVLAASLAPNFSLLLISQVAVGFACAVYLLAASLYINEIAPIPIRGLCVSAIWVSLAAGAFAATLYRGIKPVDGGFAALAVLGLAVLLAAVLGFFYLPESPRWLAFSGYPDAALSTLFKLRSDMGTAARELAAIHESCAAEDSGMEFFLQSSNYRRTIWLLLAVGVLLHGSGFIFVPYAILDLLEAGSRSTDLFATPEDSGIMKALMGSVLLAALGTALGADRLGRTRFLLYSLTLAVTMLLVLCGAAAFAPLYLSSSMLLGIILVYTLGTATAFCLLVPLLANEILPMRGREFGCSVMLFVNVALVLAGFRVYTQIIDALGYAGYFLVCLLSLMGLMYVVVRFVPETAGCALEGVQGRLLGGMPLRELGQPRH